MDLKRLKTFVAIADNGTVSKAAEVLHITQPALSRQVADLEAEVGFKLFERVGRRMMLTPRGEEILGDCRAILNGMSSLSDRVKALANGEIKVLKIAASALTIQTAFPMFMRPHAEAFPDVRLDVVEADFASQLGMLERGEAHFAITVLNAIRADELIFASVPLFPAFQIIAAFAPPVDIRGPGIDIAELCQHPLLLLDESYATRSVFNAACRIAGVKPNILLESGSTHALLALAQAGRGVAVMPSILRLEARQLRAVPVTHRREPLELTVAVLWDRRRPLPRHAKQFVELVAESVREAFSPALRHSIRLVNPA
jgi:DNA-binding transcriptional LysR family regulator